MLIYYIKDVLMFLGAIFKEYWYWIIIIIALGILIPFLLRFLRALFSRIVFVLRLSSFCSKKRAVLKHIKCPLLSLLKNHASYDFCIAVPHSDKNSNVKFFPLNPSKRNILLNDSKNAYISKVTFQTYIGKKGGIPGGNPTTLNYSETNSRGITLSIPESSSEAQSILLFQPSPHNMRISGGKANYQGYRIYEGEEFIKYLFRTL